MTTPKKSRKSRKKCKIFTKIYKIFEFLAKKRYNTIARTCVASLMTAQMQVTGENMTNQTTANLKFNMADTVMYRRYGICEVIATEIQSFGDEQKLYYCLEPIFGKKTKFFVPADMPETELDNILRKVYDKPQVETSLEETAKRSCEWQEESRIRSEHFNNLLQTGNFIDMLWLVKTLRLRKKYQREVGRTFLDMDKRVLAFAERLVFDEIAYIYDIDRENVSEFVYQLLGLPKEE